MCTRIWLSCNQVDTATNTIKRETGRNCKNSLDSLWILSGHTGFQNSIAKLWSMKDYIFIFSCSKVASFGVINKYITKEKKKSANSRLECFVLQQGFTQFTFTKKSDQKINNIKSGTWPVWQTQKNWFLIGKFRSFSKRLVCFI